MLSHARGPRNPDRRDSSRTNFKFEISDLKSCVGDDGRASACYIRRETHAYVSQRGQFRSDAFPRDNRSDALRLSTPSSRRRAGLRARARVCARRGGAGAGRVRRDFGRPRQALQPRAGGAREEGVRARARTLRRGFADQARLRRGGVPEGRGARRPKAHARGREVLPPRDGAAPHVGDAARRARPVAGANGGAREGGRAAAAPRARTRREEFDRDRRARRAALAFRKHRRKHHVLAARGRAEA